MNLPKLTDLVGKDKKVYFSFYRDGELWYKAIWLGGSTGLSSGVDYFEFPIPPDDMKGAIFKSEDKSIYFMRWIRQHLEFLRDSMKQEVQVTEQEETKVQQTKKERKKNGITKTKSSHRSRKISKGKSTSRGN